MYFTQSFGYWVRRRRKALDLTQTCLAQKVGCALITIKKIERDERRPSLQMAQRLADSLDLSLKERIYFIQAARGELAAFHLPLPDRPTESLLQTGLVTFLLVDIQGSAALWEKYPEAMREALPRYTEILNKIVESQGGTLFRMTAEDLCCVFATPHQALEAALRGQRVLYSQHWEEIGPIPTRMALHSGVAEFLVGSYCGTTYNAGLALLAAGQGGQVLLSHTTHELIHDHTLPDIELRDLGEHRLKDLSQPQHIYQLIAPGLPANFPPLMTLNTHKTNLPSQATPLIGRDMEISWVTGMFVKKDIRLLTLTGPGGVGKTRLGLQAAAAVLDDFKDGVFFVPLASVQDPGLVVSAIAQVIGIRETPAGPLSEHLTAELQGKHLLLVLDNLEHLLPAAPLLAELLRAAAGLHMLITSRAVLNLSGEHILVVEPLPAPCEEVTSVQEADRISSLLDYDSVRLFVARAQAAYADFTLNAEICDAVAEICLRLDGLPLAIELAAARLKHLSVKDVQCGLSHPLRFLTGGPQDQPVRLQALRNTLDWSYNLLDQDEKRLFARLGVFAGGFTQEAARAVYGPQPVHINGEGSSTEQDLARSEFNLMPEIDKSLYSLVDKSMIRIEEPRKGELRYGMLETIRKYALEQLSANGETDTIQRRHLEYFTCLAETAAPYLWGSQQEAWRERLAGDIDNLSVALEWSLGGEERNRADTLPSGKRSGRDKEAGVRLVSALWYFWYLRGQLREALHWLRRASQVEEASTLAQARVLTSLGTILWQLGEYKDAFPNLEQSLFLWRSLEEPAGLAEALHMFGHLNFDQRSYATARELYAESLEIYRQLQDEDLTLTLLGDMGMVAYHLGNYQAAQTQFEECLTAAEQRDMKDLRAETLNRLGDLARLRGDYSQACQMYLESADLFRQIEENLGLASGYHKLGQVFKQQGDYSQARELFLKSLEFEIKAGNKQGIVECLAGLAGLAAFTGKAELGVVLFSAAEVLLSSLGAPLAPADQVDWERDLEIARCALSEEAFKQAWQYGSSMTLDEVLQVVRDWGR